MSGFNEENEISINAFGGTEITKRALAKYVPEHLAKDFQIIPSRVRDIDEKKIRIYWQHDLAEDPEVNHLKDDNSRQRFHQFVFNSNWQLNDFVTKLNFKQDLKVNVIENPIETFPHTKKDFSNGIRLVYFSTPQRGLELLVPVFEKLSQKHNNIHLDVFSSFKIYGWDDYDAKFEPLYDKIRNHPNMTYHGFANQDVLREYLLKAHILAYPCIWKETSCRVLIESMSAGLACVHPNLAALPETSGGLTTMYQYQDNYNDHAKLFYEYLDHTINVVQTSEIQAYLNYVKTYADARFNIEKISSQWEMLLKTLLEDYPDVESRAIPKKMFTYKT